MKTIRQCNARYDLDLETMIWRRGAALPISKGFSPTPEFPAIAEAMQLVAAIKAAGKQS
jgi:hypothetical protein